MRMRKTAHINFRHFPYIGISIILLFPFIWMLITSFKNKTEIYLSPPTWIPKSLSFYNYATVFKLNFPKNFLNSLIISTSTMVIVVVLACMAAYGFSRFKFGGKSLFYTLIMIGQLVPTSVLYIPFYIAIASIGLIDNPMSVIIVCSITWLPFGVWLLTGYMKTIPVSLDEAALIDGCSFIRTMLEIIMPVAIPGIVTVAFFAFMTAWQEFLFSKIFLSSLDKRTIPLVLMAFKGQYDINWGGLMAASVIASLPICIVFVAFQKKLLSGLTSGSIKG